MRQIISVIAVGLLATTACGKDKKAKTTPVAQAEPAKETPAPVVERDEAPAEVADTSVDVSLQPTIYYEFDSAVLDTDAREVLKNNAEWLKENDGRTIVIEGHCDETGTTEYNLALGDRRAQAAKEYLVALGIPADRIRTVSYGKERPAEPGVDERNRRSVFIDEK